MLAQALIAVVGRYDQRITPSTGGTAKDSRTTRVTTGLTRMAEKIRKGPGVRQAPSSWRGVEARPNSQQNLSEAVWGGVEDESGNRTTYPRRHWMCHAAGAESGRIHAGYGG